MRIDKFLKNSRLIKRRTVAKSACQSKRVLVNDKYAKPGTEIKSGDIISLNLGGQERSVRVLETPEHVRKEDAEKMYEVL